MGKWIERDAEKHKHDYPANGDTATQVGDRWQCSCGRVFRVSKARAEYDQRDQSSWKVLEWTEEVPPATLHSERIGNYGNEPYYGPYGYGVPFGS